MPALKIKRRSIECFACILISFLKKQAVNVCILFLNKASIKCFARTLISFLKKQTAQCLHLVIKWRSIDCFAHFFPKKTNCTMRLLDQIKKNWLLCSHIHFFPQKVNCTLPTILRSNEEELIAFLASSFLSSNANYKYLHHMIKRRTKEWRLYKLYKITNQK